MTRHLRNLLLVSLAGAALVSVLAQAAPPTDAAKKPFRVFDGSPRQIVLVTNSHGGGRQLEARLKKMPGAEKVAFSSRGGGSFNGKPGQTPPGWLPKEAYDDKIPVIYVVYNAVDASAAGKRPLPEKTLEQFSGDDLAKYIEQDVRGAAMSEEEFAGSLKSLQHQVDHAAAKGIDLLILSNTHYNRTGRGGPAGADGSEEAVRRWNKAPPGQRHPAVDVRTASREVYPLDVCADRFHPCDAGREIMAHGWFSALCAWDGIATPDWSLKMVQDELAREKTLRDAIGEIKLSPAGPYAVGDTVTITWKTSPNVSMATVFFSPSPGMWAAAPLAEDLPQKGEGRLEWKIPESISWTAGGKAQTTPTVSNHCYLRVASADHESKRWIDAKHWRTTEVPFRILAAKDWPAPN